jgi:hypothetical protein
MEDIMKRKKEPKKPLTKKELLELLLDREKKEINKKSGAPYECHFFI